jgi:crotonobetainyl-CoA:carnitine CoA-transferase CaiB-like acyl-CoA transferase
MRRTSPTCCVFSKIISKRLRPNQQCPLVRLEVPNAEEPPHPPGGQPVTLSRTPSKMAARPPEVGEQTDEALAESGCSADEIVALKQRKVV